MIATLSRSANRPLSVAVLALALWLGAAGVATSTAAELPPFEGWQ